MLLALAVRPCLQMSRMEVRGQAQSMGNAGWCCRMPAASSDCTHNRLLVGVMHLASSDRATVSHEGIIFASLGRHLLEDFEVVCLEVLDPMSDTLQFHGLSSLFTHRTILVSNESVWL